jgi:hypothetical protein
MEWVQPPARCGDQMITSTPRAKSRSGGTAGIARPCGAMRPAASIDAAAGWIGRRDTPSIRNGTTPTHDVASKVVDRKFPRQKRPE